MLALNSCVNDTKSSLNQGWLNNTHIPCAILAWDHVSGGHPKLSGCPARDLASQTFPKLAFLVSPAIDVEQQERVMNNAALALTATEISSFKGSISTAPTHTLHTYTHAHTHTPTSCMLRKFRSARGTEVWQKLLF